MTDNPIIGIMMGYLKYTYKEIETDDAEAIATHVFLNVQHMKITMGSALMVFDKLDRMMEERAASTNTKD